MGIHIETEEAERLARELAKLTGESAEEAVTRALRECMARVKTRNDEGVERILAIGREIAELLGEEGRVDHADLLYDENGLPK